MCVRILFSDGIQSWKGVDYVTDGAQFYNEYVHKISITFIFSPPEMGHIEQSLVVIDRINKIFWIFYFSQSPDETEKVQSRPKAGKGNPAFNLCHL
jgi:hypothetical protein